MKQCRASRGFPRRRLSKPHLGIRAHTAPLEISKLPASFLYSAGGTMKVWHRLLVHGASAGLFFPSFQAAALPVGGQQPRVETPPSTTEQARLAALPDSPG